MKDRVDVVLAQMSTEWLNPERNLEKILRIIGEIQADKPVDLIVFPELVNTGYVKVFSVPSHAPIRSAASLQDSGFMTVHTS